MPSAKRAGRGRLGRTWVSAGPSGQEPIASLTFSIGIALEPHDWSGLSLAVGLSLAQSLHPSIQLKWPNDLWWQDRKLGGILIETASVGAQRYAVIGMGLNIHTPKAAPGAESLAHAASLFERRAARGGSPGRLAAGGAPAGEVFAAL